MNADVVIVGAGPAGASLGYRLARLGFKVLILDQEGFPRDKPCGGGLTPRALRALARTGMTLDGVLGRARPYDGYRLFAPDGHDVVLRYRHQSACGWQAGVVVQRKQFDMALLDQAMRAGAGLMDHSCVQALVRSDTGVSGVLVQRAGRAERITSAVTVVATGAQVGLLRAANLLKRGSRSPLMAVCMVLEGAEGLDDLLDMVYMPDLVPGYAWVFPVNDNLVNVGFGLHTHHGLSGRALPHVLQALPQHAPFVATKLARAKPLGTPRVWALRACLGNVQICDTGLLVVGEAAGLVDPLTGEGITFALESAEIAADVLSKALQVGDVSHQYLGRYEKAIMRSYAAYFQNASQIRACLARPGVLELLMRIGAPLAGLSGRVRSHPRDAIPRASPQPSRAIDLNTWLRMPQVFWLLLREAHLRKVPIG